MCVGVWLLPLSFSQGLSCTAMRDDREEHVWVVLLRGGSTNKPRSSCTSWRQKNATRVVLAAAANF